MTASLPDISLSKATAPPLARLLAITFVQTIASVMVFRGTYFFTREVFGFTQGQNLWLAALGMGAGYIFGAITSGWVSRRLGRQRQLLATVAIQVLVYLLPGLWPNPTVVLICYIALSPLLGWMWPVVESYIASGRDPAQTSRALGIFNMVWASGVPMGVAIVGPVLKAYPSAVFLLPAMLSAVNLGLIVPLRVPPHLAEDHPHRPEAEALGRMAAYTTSCRWTMLAGYAMTGVLAATMPILFPDRLGLSLAAAALLASCLEAPRALAFALLSHTTFWHGRRDVLLVAALLLPVGFMLVLLAPNMPGVLLGQMIFGLSHGMVYYAALYYATVVQNASIDAGKWHETMIGGGFALGPLCTLAGLGLGVMWSSPLLGMLVGAAPLVAVPLIGGVGPLVYSRRSAIAH